MNAEQAQRGDRGRKRSMGIRGKLILFSTVLLIGVIGAFAAMTNAHLDKIINVFSKSLQREFDSGLRKTGITQVQQLAEATRIALSQNEYDSLQNMALNIGKRDDRVTRVAIVDANGTLLAHDKPSLFGKKAPASLQRLSAIEKETSGSTMTIDGTRSITFAQPVFHKGTRQCTVFLALSLEPLARELKKAKELKRKEATSSTVSTLTVGLLSIFVGILLTILQGLRISRPIRSLAEQANQIARGNLNARVEITSNDEVGDLGTRFNFMTQKVQDLIVETREKIAMQRELEVAGIVQSSLIPDTSTLEVEGMKLAGDFKPATQCSGDWWCHYKLADDRVLIIVGDVTGHGVGSAMITAVAKGVINNLLLTTDRLLDVQTVLQALDRAVLESSMGRFNMTCFVTIYDPRGRTLTSANASHTFPFLYQKEAKKLGGLTVAGKALGDGTTAQYEILEKNVAPGDIVVFYTDGIVECENERGDQFSRQFRKLIPQYVDLPPDQMRDRLIGHALDFCNNTQDDDITVIIAKFE